MQQSNFTRDGTYKPLLRREKYIRVLGDYVTNITMSYNECCNELSFNFYDLGKLPYRSSGSYSSYLKRLVSASKPVTHASFLQVLSV